MKPINVVIESGNKRTFASAADWPGWSRSAKDEDSALQVLAEYGARYARVLAQSGLDFQPPADASGFTVLEQLSGNATTDFGAPGVIAEADEEPVDETERERLKTVLKACWAALDRAAEAAQGKELRKGPRGGGRDLDKMLEHVLGAEQGYLRSLGGKPEKAKEEDLQGELRQTRQDILLALDAAVAGELPREGPRGGIRWPPRYFVRRVAWHALDHAWEIEDRTID